MKVVRFSAVENFGVPIDNPELVNAPEKIAALMRAYSVPAKEVAQELTDITPYYWESNSMRYFLSRRGADGPAVVDLMPQHAGATAFMIEDSDTGPRYAGELKPATIVVPGNIPAFAVAGEGPRFVGQVCIHEFIATAAVVE
jgi:hypothetical protein